MMNKWIILVTGPVIFGACSIKRKAESTQTASASMIALEERTYRYQESMAAALNRSLAIERSWMVELPGAGQRIRYEERIRLGETAQSASNTEQREVVSSGREEKTEQYEYRTVDNVAEAKGVGWKWWLVAVIIGAGAWIAWRLIRVWPFK